MRALPLCLLMSALACASGAPELAFPGAEWQRRQPSEAGFVPGKLRLALDGLVAQAGDNPYQIAVFHCGRKLAARHANLDPQARQPSASIAKSVYASLLPIAVADGKLESADQRLVSVYPRLREAVGRFGPFPPKKRYWLPKDEAVTFRQVVTQTCGLLEDGRAPGEVWRYRTDNLVAMVHALAALYDHYRIDDPGRAPGVGDLIETKLRDPIGASWSWNYRPWRYHPEARHDIFGRFVELRVDADDLARFGLLYLAEGRWGDLRIIPREWALRAGRVAPEVRRAAPEADWRYGYAFWSNEFGRLWPRLPRDSFMAAGFGGRKVWICRSLGLVVVLLPDLPAADFMDSVEDSRSLDAVVGALADGAASHERAGVGPLAPPAGVAPGGGGHYH